MSARYVVSPGFAPARRRIFFLPKIINLILFSLNLSPKIGKNAAAYTTERPVLQKTFLNLKIRGL